jgi:hypothetical protein
MKKIISTVLFIVTTLAIHGQNQTVASDISRLSISPILDASSDALALSPKNALVKKMSDILLKDGLASGQSRFLMPAIVLTEFTPIVGPPYRVKAKCDISFYIADGLEKRIFSSIDFSITGIGPDEERALKDAFSKISTSSPEILEFIKKGKQGIVDYFDTNCDNIITKAMAKASRNEHDSAIADLIAVPDVCSECYTKCLDKGTIVYQAKLNFDCAEHLKNARLAWSAKPNQEGANQVRSELSKISPDATCIDEAVEFCDIVGKRMYEIDGREWNFKLMQEIELNKLTIDAFRQVGVATGENQQTNFYSIKNW